MFRITRFAFNRPRRIGATSRKLSSVATRMIADVEASKNVRADDMVEAIASELKSRLGSAPANMPLEATVYTARKV